MIDKLLTVECFPTAMEFFTAVDEDSWSLITRLIDGCDYIVLIVAGKYGKFTADQPLSFTEREYQYAKASGKPVITFLHHDPFATLTGDRIEQTDEGKAKLRAFREQITAGKGYRPWTNGDSLAAEVVASLPSLFESRPSPGWVRGDTVGSPEKLLELRERIEALKANNKKLRRLLPPPDVESLAQGDDELTVRIHYFDSQDRSRMSSVAPTWDEFFRLVGSYLSMTGSEPDELRAHVALALAERHIGSAALSPYINLYDFNPLLVQLVSLGLIERNAGPDWWRLTPYGKHYLSRVTVQRRPVP